MSYWELWDNFSKVKENWESSRDLIYYLIEFLGYKIEVEQEYSLGLKRLLRSPLFIRGKNTILPSLFRIQACLNQQILNLSTLIDQQSSDLIPSLKKLIQQQDEIVKAKARYAKGFESELQKNQKNIEKTKDSYYSACETCENNTKNEENAEKKYLKAIEEANKFFVLFEENMKPIFLMFQAQETEKLNTIKDCFRKYAVYEISYCRACQYELDLLPNAFDSLSPEIEIKKFIDDTTSGKEFQAFSAEIHPKRMCKDHSSDFFDKKQCEILDSIIEKCWKSVLINDEDNKNFNEILGLQEGRKYWVLKLNEKRMAEEFLVPSCTFGILCGLTNTLLDRIYENQDVNCAKQIMFLSQYFYEETLSQKTFMHQILLTHQLWDDHKLWSNLIITSVDLEIEGDSILSNQHFATSHQSLKIRPVVCNKLTNYLQQMKNFMLDTMTIEKVLGLIQEYYSFSIDIKKLSDL